MTAAPGVSICCPHCGGVLGPAVPGTPRLQDSKMAKVRVIPIGQSDFFPAASAAERSRWQSTAASITKIHKAIRYTTRTVTRDGVVGLEIWRTA